MQFTYTNIAPRALTCQHKGSTYLAMPRVAVKPSRAVSELLRTRREELGLTLREVEKKTAEAGELIPFPSLARVEQGRADPGVRRLHLLLRLYQVPPQLVSDVVELEDLAGELPRTQDARRLYDDGLDHWRRGELGKGIAHLVALQKLLKDRPKERLFRQKATVSLAIMASSLGKHHLALDLVGKLLLEPPEESLLTSVLVQAGTCWHRLGSCEAALAFLERAEKHLEPHSHRERAWVLHEKASTLTTPGRCAEATETLDRAIAAYRKAEDPYGESRALAVRARILLKQGDTPSALEATRQARLHAERHGFTRLRILRRIDEAHARLLLGDAAQSVSLLRGALAEAVTEGDRHGEFHAHHGLWKAHTALGQKDQAAFELGAARHYVRFVDEASDEAQEIRSHASSEHSRKRQMPRRGGTTLRASGSS